MLGLCFMKAKVFKKKNANQTHSTAAFIMQYKGSQLHGRDREKKKNTSCQEHNCQGNQTKTSLVQL